MRSIYCTAIPVGTVLEESLTTWKKKNVRRKTVRKYLSGNVGKVQMPIGQSSKRWKGCWIACSRNGRHRGSISINKRRGNLDYHHDDGCQDARRIPSSFEHSKHSL